MTRFSEHLARMIERERREYQRCAANSYSDGLMRASGRLDALAWVAEQLGLDRSDLASGTDGTRGLTDLEKRVASMEGREVKR